MGARYIRYLAATEDSTPTGKLALEYLKGLLALRVPIRLGSMTGGLSGQWEHYAQLLVSPMNGDLVNVVCCDHSRWTWEQRVPMPKRTPNGELVLPGQIARGWQELYTVGVHNVLITGEPCYDTRLTREQIVTARRYEAIVGPNDHYCKGWGIRAREVRCIPVPVTDHAALRAVVLP